MVGILKEDRGVGFAIDCGVVASANQRVGFRLFAMLAFDELNDIRMVHVQNNHLGRATRFAATFDDAREGVETLHETDRTRGNAAAGESFFAAA